MEQLIQQLKVILGTNFALYLKAHNFHWNIEGSNFPQYHSFLDILYNLHWFDASEICDEERQRRDREDGFWAIEDFMKRCD
jgi:starvation-inducible DNA-binding protein